ncbi:MAG TPA: 3-deoxy-manno-octulosonate cytidylyltransferase [Steroidobacteraceae bacterium]|nr:3-deoxy-manno-octulosonate cytidylyltransferase [Steroidobacteraceae bacterium]
MTATRSLAGADPFRVVIPARYGSTRLPGKALLPLAGKPMLQWVHEAACASGAREVLIATDDERIVRAAQSFAAEAILTAAEHASGTDRIAEVASTRRWAADDVVVNVQGDEPLMPAAVIAQVAALLRAAPQAQIATLATPIESLSELLDPNVVKVVTDARGLALYFSRAPIPWNRDGATAGIVSQSDCSGARRHRGIYAYRVAALLQLAQLPQGMLEEREKLEQLRALEHGLAICVGDAIERPGPDVNTLADLQHAAAVLAPRPR